jgi:hypothetical protein
VFPVHYVTLQLEPSASSSQNSHWRGTLLFPARRVKPPEFLIDVIHYQDLVSQDMSELKKHYYSEQLLRLFNPFFPTNQLAKSPEHLF